MILVVGQGRSGTSLVARLLHEQLRIRMGSHFDPPHRTWPGGNYEDQALRSLHIQYTLGRDCDRATLIDNLRYVGGVRERIAKQEGWAGWGVKDPRASLMIPEYSDAFGESLRIVCCYRDPPDVVESMLRAWPHIDRAEAEAGVAERTDALVRELLVAKRDHLWLDFTRHRRESELLDVLRSNAGNLTDVQSLR